MYRNYIYCIYIYIVVTILLTFKIKKNRFKMKKCFCLTHMRTAQHQLELTPSKLKRKSLKNMLYNKADI